MSEGVFREDFEQLWRVERARTVSRLTACLAWACLLLQLTTLVATLVWWWNSDTDTFFGPHPIGDSDRYVREALPAQKLVEWLRLPTYALAASGFIAIRMAAVGRRDNEGARPKYKVALWLCTLGLAACVGHLLYLWRLEQPVRERWAEEYRNSEIVLVGPGDVIWASPEQKAVYAREGIFFMRFAYANLGMDTALLALAITWLALPAVRATFAGDVTAQGSG